MTPNHVLTIGCLALATITIWMGSLYLTNRPKSKRQSEIREPVQLRPELAYCPNPFDHFIEPWRISRHIRPLPNIPPLGYHERGQIDRVVHGSWGPAPSRPSQTQRNTTRTLFENWRKSIFGLIALSESNLKSAEDHVKIGDETTAVQHARTSVENMARALIHCCGGKPDSDPGQEEVLRMLSPRFKGETRAAYDNVVDKINYLRVSQKTKQTLQIALEITLTFKKVILSNFGEEIQWRSSAMPQH